MLSSFVLYIAKKNGSLHHPTKYNSLPFLESFYNWVFFYLVFFFFLFYLCIYKLCVFFFGIRFKVYVKVLSLGFI
jgi:hypothetical protein